MNKIEKDNNIIVTIAVPCTELEIAYVKDSIEKVFTENNVIVMGCVGVGLVKEKDLQNGRKTDL